VSGGQRADLDVTDRKEHGVDAFRSGVDKGTASRATLKKKEGYWVRFAMGHTDASEKLPEGASWETMGLRRGKSGCKAKIIPR